MYLQKFNMILHSALDDEVVYRIPKEYEKKLSKITLHLEKKEKKLKLKSFEIVSPTIKDLIWKLSTDVLKPGSIHGMNTKCITFRLMIMVKKVYSKFVQIYIYNRQKKVWHGT